MTQRDTLTRVRLTPVSDGAGGNSLPTIEELEIVPAHISVGPSTNDITMYGVKTQQVLHAVVDYKLDEYVNTRYEWSGRFFKLMSQVKHGNEYYATLMEVNE